MSTLAGRTAIITGAGRGLGREHALLFAKLGANVVINDVTSDASDGTGPHNPAQAVVDEVVALGGQAAAHSGSASDWNAAESLVQLAVDTYGSLDILVNNAGILRDRSIANMSEDEWDSVVDVHLKGHFAPLRHAAAYWRDKSKAGDEVNASVINTSSGSGLRGNPGQANYAAAKAGIAMMTIVASRELVRYGVRVNAIAPVARTRLVTGSPGLAEYFAVPEEGFDKWAPENVSPLVAYLASAGSTASGQVFTVMGGRVALQRGWVDEFVHEQDARWDVDELAVALKDVPAAAPEITAY